jgi:phosphoserine phosphatase RsbU/P
MTDSNHGLTKIMIVDDDPTSLDILQIILKREGFLVITAINGLEGRLLAEREQPDLIIMDINMPVEDGLTACAALKTNACTSDIPIIFISTVEDVNSKINGFNAGGVDYIMKPFEVLEVIARVRLQIRLYHSYRSMVASNLEQLKHLTASQKSILVQPEELPEAGFSVLYLPAHAAGGDFYDVIHAGAGIFDYIVADISGHDAGTALPTAALKALLRQNISMLYSPIENLNLVNRNLRPVLQEDQFFTLVYARLNRTRNRLSLVSAGHPPVILCRSSGEVEIIAQSGDGLGIFKTITLDVKELTLAKGDCIFLFSDGLIEQDLQGSIMRRTGLNNLANLIKNSPLPRVEAVVKTIQERFTSINGSLLDDIALLGFYA